MQWMEARQSQFGQALSNHKNPIKYAFFPFRKRTLMFDVAARHFHEAVFANSWWFFNFYSFSVRRAVTLVVTEVTKPWLHEVFGQACDITQCYHNHFPGPTRTALWDNKCTYSLTLLQKPCSDSKAKTLYISFWEALDNDVICLNQKVPNNNPISQGCRSWQNSQKVSCPALSCSSLELQEENNFYIMSEAQKPPVPIGGLITSSNRPTGNYEVRIVCRRGYDTTT